MSLDQGSLKERSKGKGTKSDSPRYKYLADSINLESYDWASRGASDLANEFKSAKSESKRSGIIEALSAAIVRTELEIDNPKASSERVRELKLMRLEFVRTRQELEGTSSQSKTETKKKEVTESRKPKYDEGMIYLGHAEGLHYLKDPRTGGIYAGKGETESDYRFESNFLTPHLRTILKIPEEPKPIIDESDTRSSKEKLMDAIADAAPKKIAHINEELRNLRYEHVELTRKRDQKRAEGHDVTIENSRIYQKRTEIQKLEKEQERIVEHLQNHPQYEERYKEMKLAKTLFERIRFQWANTQQGFVRAHLSKSNLETILSVIDRYEEKQQALGMETGPDTQAFREAVQHRLENADEEDRSYGIRLVERKQTKGRLVALKDQPTDTTKTFTERPTAGKQFKDLASIGKTTQIWEMTEYEYHRYKHYADIKRITRNNEIREQNLTEMVNGKFVIRGRKREEELAALHYWKKRLNELQSTTPEETWKDHKKGDLGYAKEVKNAIKSGKPVPQEVIEQYSEFKIASDSRERYEKGLHTSFANKSIAINDSMREERGYKVKRQDGKQITDQQIQFIGAGVTEVEEVTGDLKKYMHHTDLTIAHTSGKNPFLMQAGGLYSTLERTITTGTGVPSLAHEMAHWLDYESGAVTGHGVVKPVTKSRKEILTSLAEIDNATDGNQLIKLASESMNDVREAERIMKMKLQDAQSDEEKKEIQMMKFKLGKYYYEPREIWARLFEQYIAVKLEDQEKKPSVSIFGRRYNSTFDKTVYNNTPAYWTNDAFEKMMPAIEKEINRRIALLESRMEQPQ